MKFSRLLKQSVQKFIWNFFWKNFQLPQVLIEELVENVLLAQPRFMEKIYLPPYKGNREFHDFSYLISLISGLKPKTILELGTAYGNTVANICAVCDARIFTVNALPEQLEGNLITSSLEKDDIGYIYRKNNYKDRVVQIYQNTKKINILEWISPRTIDFAIIDACHDSDFVVNDFLKILPALSNQAIVLFHDTNPSLNGHLIDSYVGCMFLRKLGYNIKHISGSSWAIWSYGDQKISNSIRLRVSNFIYSYVGSLLFQNQVRFINKLRMYTRYFQTIDKTGE